MFGSCKVKEDRSSALSSLEKESIKLSKEDTIKGVIVEEFSALVEIEMFFMARILREREKKYNNL